MNYIFGQGDISCALTDTQMNTVISIMSKSVHFHNIRRHDNELIEFHMEGEGEIDYTSLEEIADMIIGYNSGVDIVVTEWVENPDSGYYFSTDENAAKSPYAKWNVC